MSDLCHGIPQNVINRIVNQSLSVLPARRDIAAFAAAIILTGKSEKAHSENDIAKADALLSASDQELAAIE